MNLTMKVSKRWKGRTGFNDLARKVMKADTIRAKENVLLGACKMMRCAAPLLVLTDTTPTPPRKHLVVPAKECKAVGAQHTFFDFDKNVINEAKKLNSEPVLLP